MQTQYAQSFVPLGDAVIEIDDLAADAASPTRELDLKSGVHRSRAGSVRTTTFVAHETSVLVHVIEPALPVRVALDSPLRGPVSDAPVPVTPDDGTQALLLRLPSDVAPGHEPDLPAARWSHEPGSALEATIAARVVAEQSRTIVLLTTATTFAGPGERPVGSAADALRSALARLDEAARTGVDRLLSDTEATMRSLLNSVELSFGDAPDAPEAPDAPDTSSRLRRARADPGGVLAADPNIAALLFDYGRYLLVSSSRAGVLPANLQGIWNSEMRPPWGSAYTVNINTEMNYWGAHVTSLSDHARPLTSFTRALAARAAEHTARLYGAPGWTVHHNTDAWLYATAPGRGAGDPRWSFWPMGGAWLASMLTEAWEFGAAGIEHLGEIWPTLRGAAEFALSWHRDGTTSPATSPENAFLLPDGEVASLTMTSTMDTALLRALWEKTVSAADALGFDDDQVVQAASARLRSLPSMPEVTPSGLIVEWDGARPEQDRHHRHLSHLFGLFPGTELWDDDRLAAAAATLERRGDDSSGWSLVWKLALWARLGRADRAGDLIELFLRDAEAVSGEWAGGLYPNLFAAHPPFQIDANLGFIGALVEMLLQSHDGIRLLPALAPQLKTGRVSGLVARPGILVDLEWRDGELLSAGLRARTAASVGAHRVHWRDRTITVHIDTEREINLDARSFLTEEVVQ